MHVLPGSGNPCMFIVMNDPASPEHSGQRRNRELAHGSSRDEPERGSRSATTFYLLQPDFQISVKIPIPEVMYNACASRVGRPLHIYHPE